MYHRCIKVLALATATAISFLPATPVFADDHDTNTPIKHLVVIFQENVSFDHYFGTYPMPSILRVNPPSTPRKKLLP